MDFVDKNIEKYVEALSDKESPLLKEINEYTINHVHQPRMLSGHLQGRILSFISKIKHPKNILEIGTYTGYSALCLAEGLAKGGKLITIDRDKSLHDIVHEFFKRSDYAKNIQQLIGEAINIIPEIDLKFDLVFIDADKKNYKEYYEKSLILLKKNGLIIIDNVLWYGQVVDENSDDKITLTIKDFNNYVSKDKRVEKIIVPLGDGMTVCRKL